jgi:hypothetical protein
MTDVVKGTAVYLRNMHGLGASDADVTRGAMDFVRRAKVMGLSWTAIGAVWQDSPTASKFMNPPNECHIYAKVMHDSGITPYVWGYPWLGSEQKFIDGMVECAGDLAHHLLDPELGMNPTRDKNHMDAPNASAAAIVAGLRAKTPGRIIGLSTFGGIPSWFPLRAFLKAGVDFAGGQTYTDDPTIDMSIASFLKEMQVTGSSAQLVPNFGIYARNDDGSVRSKMPDEFRKHLDEFVNEGESVRAMIGWAENFLKPQLEAVLGEFSARLKLR